MTQNKHKPGTSGSTSARSPKSNHPLGIVSRSGFSLFAAMMRPCPAGIRAAGILCALCRQILRVRVFISPLLHHSSFKVYGEDGSNSRFWPSLRKAAREGEDFPMTDGLQVRDFVRVQDVAACFLKFLIRYDLLPAKPVIENVGSGRPRTLLEFAAEERDNLNATAKLLPGVVSIRANEFMRYVPALPNIIKNEI